METISHPTTIPEPVSVERGLWSVEAHAIMAEPVGDLIRRVIPAGTRNSVAADLLARLSVYPRPADLDERLERAADNGTRVTALYHGETYFGAPYVSIRQGRLFHGQRGVGILPPGGRTKGFVLNNVVDLIEDPAKNPVAALGRRWYDQTILAPTTPVTLEALNGASEDHPIAVVWTHPGFGSGAVPGCVWYVDGVEDEIANGFLYCPPSELISEHGSIEVGRLVNEGALVLAEPRVRFAQLFDLPSEPLAAYRAIFG